MNALKNKLKSQRGASITFALLLFLVCAIISIVVIVAATAVGGRASKMAEMDQRYYAVNSAAEYLRDVLVDQTVMVTTGKRTKSKVDQDGNPVDEAVTTDLTPVLMLKNDFGDFDDISADTSLVAKAASILTVTGETSELEALSLTVDGFDEETTQALAATLVPKEIKDGKMVIQVSNTDATKGTYTLELTFKADVVENKNKHTSYGTPIPKREGGKVVDGKYTREKIVEETTVTTISWNMIDLKTLVAVRPTAAAGGTP